MKLDDFVGQGWQDHATDARGVWGRLPQGVELVATAADAVALANLAVHVAGEHLGLWDEGVAFLERLEAHPARKTASGPETNALARLRAVLLRCKGDRTGSDALLAAHRSTGVPEASDRIRVLSIAAAALAGQKRTAEAAADWKEALALASYGPAKSDPAARALAVTGNNLAAELEEKAELSPEERALMLEAATTARRFWEIAGAWQEVERAEYRLASSLLRAGDAARALVHAGRCLEIVAANGGDPGELFFAHEAAARAHAALGNAAAARGERDKAASVLGAIGDEGFRELCRGELAKLDRRIPNT